ncbi:uncharacterized protein LOC110715065 [Chenopodium quinoa]|uniref:uncharacterized protein LOC110715065 n=1 Tax=Chenopodium quinoa TaxID=63459 RepID=UPI000B775ABE|nr:uncharacterized protein LOC110715065 [Chenopodium quinoa]
MGSVFFKRQRVPRTTAKRKGIVISSSTSGGDSDQHIQSGVGSRALSVSVGLNGSESLSVHDEQDADEANEQEDRAYEPYDSDDDTVESVDIEEQLSEDEYGPKIEDSWDPFEEHIFECDKDEENYLAKLYNNAEVFKDEGFGRIVLKEWQLFTDKQHLRDVVRDYCIQCGFAVIVDYANNTRYTVR